MKTSNQGILFLACSLGLSMHVGAKDLDSISSNSDLISSNTYIANNPTPEQGFGLNSTWTVFSSLKCIPWQQSHPIESSSTTYGYSSPVLGSSLTVCEIPLDELPNGAVIDKVHIPVFDKSTEGFIDTVLLSYQASSTIDPTAETKIFGQAGTGSTQTGDAITLEIIPSSPYILSSWGDLSSDGAGDLQHRISIRLLSGDTPGDLGFFSAVVEWHRTISPAPNTASFDDVPTNHWAFTEIEAFTSSGISSGCGGNNYCPDANVTRAQMAVFLSRALGLHWPN